MDPMLVKLFDLWDLDDSSVRHVLPSSSYICRSEPIHSPKRSLCYANGLENHLSELSGADTDLCKQCKSPNRDDANWCIECGTAMVGTSVSSADSQAHCDISLVPEPHSPCSNFSVKSRHEATYTSTYNSPSQQVNFHLDKNSTSNIESASHHTPDKVTQLQGQSRIGNGQVNHLYECDSVVRHTHVTDHLIANKQTDSTPKSSDTLAFPPISTTQQNAGRVRKKDTSSLMGTRNNYQRHWNSSSVYRWRKPSSIQKCNLQTLPGDVPGGCTNPTKICSVVHGGHSAHVPVIDLSALQSDFKLSLKCISTRKSSSINVSPALPLLLLPDEIILTVLSSLSQKDLANCMLVCRRLFHIASLWSKVQVQKCSGICEEHLQLFVKKQPRSVLFQSCKGILNYGAIQRFFSRMASKLEVFEMTLCDFGVGGGDMMFINAALYCPKLRSITFNWCNLSESAIVKGFRTFSRLEEVSVEQQSGGFCNEAIQLLIKKHGKTLRRLNVGLLDCTTVMALCGQQKLSNIVSYTGTFVKMDESTFKMIAIVFPNLKELAIRHYTESNLNHETTKQLLNNLVHLESLSLKLSNPCALSQACCKHINQMVTLRALVLDCVNDEALQTLCTGKLKLKFLDLSQSGITDKSFTIMGVSSFSSTLTHVRMSKCHGIDVSYSKRVMASLKDGQVYEDSVRQLLKGFIQNCKRLKVVDLSWLHCVQDLKLDYFEPCKIVVN